MLERGVSEDEDAGCAEDPEGGGEGRGDEEHRDADHEEAGVEVLLGNRVIANLHGFRGWRQG